MNRAVCCAGLVLGALAGARGADVAVVKKDAAKTGISLSGLQAEGERAALFRRVLENDLKRSGWFEISPAGGAVAVSGSCRESGGTVAVQCDVRNAADGRMYVQCREQEPADRARRLAHRVADDIVWNVKKCKGIASTRIVMVGAPGGRKDIFICDADGEGLVQITRDGAPCLSPRWGAADRIYYTSMHRGYPDIYALNLAGNTRDSVANFPGLNLGGDVSPDGRRMVLTLSKDGNPELYVMGIGDRRLTRLTRTQKAAEASPAWSPDGNSVVFVSNRSGSPQLYVMSAAGGEPKRITFRGSQNVAPDWGPDGRIAFSSLREGRFQIGVMNPADGSSGLFTADGADHEDPSWARDGRHLVYTRTEAYRSQLYILDTLGDPELRLMSQSGNWTSPDWSAQ